MTIKSGVKTTRDDVERVLRSIKTLTGLDVLVGIPAANTERREKGEPINNAQLGYIHENGAPKANIPARPFLIPGVRNARPKVIQFFKKAAEAVLRKDLEGASRALHAAGLTAQNEVRAVINAGPPPPLSVRTLEARRARGRTGEVPLIDTGQLRNSITYVLRTDKK
jgi:phage gpG-like protein